MRGCTWCKAIDHKILNKFQNYDLCLKITEQQLIGVLKLAFLFQFPASIDNRYILPNMVWFHHHFMCKCYWCGHRFVCKCYWCGHRFMCTTLLVCVWVSRRRHVYTPQGTALLVLVVNKPLHALRPLSLLCVNKTLIGPTTNKRVQQNMTLHTGNEIHIRVKVKCWLYDIISTFLSNNLRLSLPVKKI